ncbi:hypothetical protein YC2023_044113 [Brassica napus]
MQSGVIEPNTSSTGILYISLVMLVHLKKGCEKSCGDDTSALKLKLQLKNVSQIIYRGLPEIDAFLVLHNTHLRKLQNYQGSHGICCTRGGWIRRFLILDSVGGRVPSGGEIVEKGRREDAEEDDEITENQLHMTC